MNTFDKRWIDPQEFELIFNIKVSTQAKWRMLNKIPYSKMGKCIRYDRLLIEKYFENHSIN
jgi:hypothetical protein